MSMLHLTIPTVRDVKFVIVLNSNFGFKKFNINSNFVTVADNDDTSQQSISG